MHARRKQIESGGLFPVRSAGKIFLGQNWPQIPALGGSKCNILFLARTPEMHVIARKGVISRTDRKIRAWS